MTLAVGEAGAAQRRARLKALRRRWDYEDRLNGRGRYAPWRSRPRRRAMRELGQVLALVAVSAVVLYVMSSDLRQ
jgi:hypothetical protein